MASEQQEYPNCNENVDSKSQINYYGNKLQNSDKLTNLHPKPYHLDNEQRNELKYVISGCP